LVDNQKWTVKPLLTVAVETESSLTCCKLSKARASGAERQRGKERVGGGGGTHREGGGKRGTEIERKGGREREARAAGRV
jgi:hypothetical protein